MNSTAVPYSTVYLVNPQLDRATDADVQVAERTLKTHFPQGYREFVTTLGKGLYCDLIRVYLPQRVAAEVGEFRDRVSEYFVWDEGEDVLPRSRAVESICIADTVGGDEVVFHPDDAAQLYLLPHDSETIPKIGSTFDAALAWILQSGELTTPSESRYFDSGIARQSIELVSVKKRPTFARLKTALLKLGLHDYVNEVAEGRRSKALKIFVKAIGGSVSCAGSARTYRVYVAHACEGPNESLDRLLKELEKLGLVPPRDPQGNPHPAIAGLRSEFFKFDGILPCPIPPQDRQPRDVAMAFVRAMHAWESGLGLWHKEGYPFDIGHELIRDIYADLCVAGQDGDNATFSIPPEYDPANEQIIDEQAVSPDVVRVTTRVNDRLETEHTFEIHRENGVWRLGSVSRSDSFSRRRNR